MEGDTKANGGYGPMVGIIIILLVIVLGGLYFWSTREKTEVNDDQGAVATTTSDSPTSIQNDLNSTQVENIDTNL